MSDGQDPHDPLERLRRRRLATASPTSTSAPDGWQGDAEQAWVLTYLDVLTLVLVLFVILLGMSTLRDSAAIDDGPRTDATAATARLVEGTLAPEAFTVLGDASGVRSALVDLEGAAQVPASEDVDAATSDALDAEALPDQGPASLPADGVAADEPSDDALAWDLLPESVERIERPGQVELRIRDDILFATAQAELSAAGRALLLELRPVFEAHPGVIQVEGHTDAVPIATERFPSNWELSTARASSVVRALIETGIDAQRLQAIGFADTQPLADNATAEGRSRNRRVVIVLSKPAPEPG